MVAIYAVRHNFMKTAQALRMTSAAGVSQTLWSMDDLMTMMDEFAPKPGPRGHYKKKA